MFKIFRVIQITEILLPWILRLISAPIIPAAKNTSLKIKKDELETLQYLLYQNTHI